MLVVDADRLGSSSSQTVQALPSQQRFAFMVLTGFAVALTLLAMLFVTSGDPSPRSQIVGLPAMVTSDDRVAGGLGTVAASPPVSAAQR